MLGLILFIIAYVLYFPLTLINFLFVRNKGYFRDSALTLDKLANREFRTLWNKTLIKEIKEDIKTKCTYYVESVKELEDLLFEGD